MLWSTLSEYSIHHNRTGETVQVVRGRGATALSRAGGGPRQFSIRHRETPQNGARSPVLFRLAPHLSPQTSNGRVQIGRQVLGYLRVSHPWFEVTHPAVDFRSELG